MTHATRRLTRVGAVSVTPGRDKLRVTVSCKAHSSLMLTSPEGKVLKHHPEKQQTIPPFFYFYSSF